MKLKLLFAVGTLALISAWLVIWLRPQSYPGDDFHLSRVDFRGVQQAIRHAMWRKAFPGASWQTIEQLPHSARQLATTRIHRIDKLGGDKVQVQMKSRYGDYYYLLEGCQGTGRKNWRVLSEGPNPLMGIITRYRGPESFGASVSFGADVYETHPFVPGQIAGFAATNQRPVLSEGQFSATLSNHARLTLGR